MLSRLTRTHALEVYRFDALVDLSIRRLRGRSQRGRRAGKGSVVGIPKALAPVREVGADDEGVGRVGEVGRKQFPQCSFCGCGCVADHDRDQVWKGVGSVGLGQDLVDVGSVHLKAVLVLVGALVHVLEVAGFVELGGCGGVDGEVAERCAVVGALGQGGFFEVEVVGWSEEEDALAVD